MRTTSRAGAAWCGAIALAAVAMSGCGGGGGRLSVSRYTREASGICSTANHDIAHVDVPSPTEERSVSRAVGRIVVIQRDSVDDLRGLKPPSALVSLNARWVALLDQGTDELEHAGVWLRDGKRRLARNYAKKASILFERADGLVQEQGMTSCRGPALNLG